MPLLSILFYVFVAVVSIQISYYGSFLISFAIQPFKKKRGKRNIPISVIICAKNEAKNLKKNIPLLLEQDYPNFEIVLVNDASTDNTLKVIKGFALNNSNIKVVDVKSTEAFWGNKKYALTLGIKASKHDFLAFTDADCYPQSKFWLKELSSQFSNQKSIVLGYGAYAKKPFSFLNKLIRFETVITAMQYFAYTKMGLPYMGVGRNMAYRKELFFNNSGFSSHMFLKSGDDDLFINEVANSSNTAISIAKESFTVSTPKQSFKTWVYQKRRHVSTANYYKLKHKLLLSLFFFSQLLFWILGVILLITGFNLHWSLSLILLRYVIQLVCFGLTAKKLNEVDLIILMPLLELFLISTQLSIFIANLISQPKHWK